MQLLRYREGDMEKKEKEGGRVNEEIRGIGRKGKRRGDGNMKT